MSERKPTFSVSAAGGGKHLFLMMVDQAGNQHHLDVTAEEAFTAISAHNSLLDVMEQSAILMERVGGILGNAAAIDAGAEMKRVARLVRAPRGEE